MQPKRPNSMSPFVMLVTLGVAAPLILAECQVVLVQAQDAPTTIRIDNLTRMAPINQALKKQYETQFSDTTVEIKTRETNSSLQLQNKQSDLAAISRLLTPAEKAQGLVQVPVTREKIAIVVGKDNDFTEGLTIDQVIKIFRGEITDWSQLGGKPGPIRVIHRPIANNLQGTLQTYDLFRKAPFEAGGNTVQLDQDSVTALATELGTDGISYALASQILDAKGIRPVSMYKTLPDDPKYPFSQPFTYVYQGKPSPSTEDFLNYVATEQGQQAIAEAKTQPALFSDLETDSTSASSPASGDPDTTTSPNPNNPSGATDSPSSPTSNQDASAPDSTSTDSSDKAEAGSNALRWLPLALIVLVLGGVIGGILKTLLAKRKPKALPRPAPNYAEKIRPTTIQGSSTQLQEPPESLTSNSPPIKAENSPLAPDNIGLGAAAGAAAAGVAETLSSPAPPPYEDEPGSSKWMDITSEELRSQTRIQDSKTELQDTPPWARGPETQLQDPSTTPLQDPQQTWNQNEAFSQGLDPSPTQLQDPSTTQLQDSSPTQLQPFDDHESAEANPTQVQDSSPTQLQDPSTTQLQDPQQTWNQDEAFSQGLDPSPTQLQDSSPTQLQDPKQTWPQDEAFPQKPDPSATQLQDPSVTQLQNPQETWGQDQEFPEGIDPSSTQLQDPSQTQLQDPKQTWSQDD